ncbi:MAG: zinc metalloprotease HtpX, partial [Mailhella sp.]|nr:zinc metalloprotease HtpX [Mailhella sp.]
MTSQIKTLVLMAALSAVLIFMGGALGGQQGILIALVFALIMNVGSYWYSDKIVLSMYRAQELSPADAPVVHQIVDELARNAGIPKPRLYIVPQEAPNAFATGRDPQHGVIAVTQGIMRLLPPEQLRGVLAHEMAHIANRDILVQSVAGVIASAITAIANMLQFAMIFGGNRDEEGNGTNPLAAIAMMILGPLAASLIQMAISRRREYMADAAGASYCKDPMALAMALNNLDAYSRHIPMQANPATENMFIVNPLSGDSMRKLFSTHPP